MVSSRSAFEEEPVSVRSGFAQDLEELKAQVDHMASLVTEAIEGSTKVLMDGDARLAQEVISRDDEIDAMFVSLTERCYEFLARQAPVASDMRLIVSVLRTLADLERIGDLCLRIVKLTPAHPLLISNPKTFEILRSMASEAQALFAAARSAWVHQDLRLAHSLDRRDDAMDAHYSRLMDEVLELRGPRAVPLALQSLSAGRAFERIADHAVMIGERLRYMLTGNAQSLSSEIGP